jgi:hypothetical protein
LVEERKQIPFEDDRKKSKCKRRSRFPNGNDNQKSNGKSNCRSLRDEKKRKKRKDKKRKEKKEKTKGG